MISTFWKINLKIFRAQAPWFYFWTPLRDITYIQCIYIYTYNIYIYIYTYTHTYIYTYNIYIYIYTLYIYIQVVIICSFPSKNHRVFVQLRIHLPDPPWWLTSCRGPPTGNHVGMSGHTQKSAHSDGPWSKELLLRFGEILWNKMLDICICTCTCRCICTCTCRCICNYMYM